MMAPFLNQKGSEMAVGGIEEAMLDTIFCISTLVFFVASVLYVKFCDGLR
jgi:hypothetical protein